MRRHNSRWASTPHHWYLVGVAIVLSGVGLAMLYSAGQTVTGENSGFWQYQLIWLFVALAAYAVVGSLPMRLAEESSRILYAASLLLLIAVLAFPPIGGARSWIRIGGLGFQPSEFAKIATILIAARWVASLDRRPRRLSELVTPAALFGLPAVLTMLQPDIGTTTVYVLLLAGVCFWAGASPALVFLLLSPLVGILLTFSLPLWSFYIVGVGVLLFLMSPGRGTWLYVGGANLLMGIVALPLWNSLAGYQKQRLLVFIEPESDPTGAGWNVIQSKVAIGSGGLFGKGFMDGTQKRLAFLPERHTDFVFSVLGEELGFLGVLLAFCLFSLLLIEGIRIAERHPEAFGSTVAFALVVLIGSHVAINTAMAVGLLPITGLPLPFLSKGGSFLVVCFIAVGLWRQIWAERYLVQRA